MCNGRFVWDDNKNMIISKVDDVAVFVGPARSDDRHRQKSRCFTNDVALVCKGLREDPMYIQDFEQ